METKTKSVQIYTGLFRDRESVEQVYNLIYRKGYNVKHVNMIMSTDTYKKYFSGDRNIKSGGLGSPITNFYNGIIDIVKAGLIIPGHPVFITGPVSAGLSGAGAGGFSTGIVSSLLGIPDVYAQKFEAGIQDGHIVMNIQPRSEEDAHYIEEIWQQNYVEEIYKK